MPAITHRGNYPKMTELPYVNGENLARHGPFAPMVLINHDQSNKRSQHIEHQRREVGLPKGLPETQGFLQEQQSCQPVICKAWLMI